MNGSVNAAVKKPTGKNQQEDGTSADESAIQVVAEKVFALGVSAGIVSKVLVSPL